MYATAAIYTCQITIIIQFIRYGRRQCVCVWIINIMMNSSVSGGFASLSHLREKTWDEPL